MIGIEQVGFYKKGSGIHIKKKNRGKFTASAKRAGKSVQQHARDVLADPNATPLQKKRANFARNASKWKHKDGAKIHKLFDNRLIKRHQIGGPIEVLPTAARDNTYVSPTIIPQKIKRYVPKIETFSKLEDTVDNDTRTEAHRKYVETFNKLGGEDLQDRTREARTQEANKYTIPYIPEKEIMLTAGRYNTGRISTNLLDSIYAASQRTGVPFDTALGLAGRESTLGIGRGFKTGQRVSGTDLYSNWQQIQSIINPNSARKKANKLWDRIRNNEQLTDEEYNYLTQFLENTQKELDSTKVPQENPIDNALKYYKTGKYNPGDKRHTQMVEEDARILMSDPKIKQWMKQKGI